MDATLLGPFKSAHDMMRYTRADRIGDLIFTLGTLSPADRVRTFKQLQPRLSRSEQVYASLLWNVFGEDRTRAPGVLYDGDIWEKEA